MKFILCVICCLLVVGLTAEVQDDGRGTPQEPIKKYGPNVDVRVSTESVSTLPTIPPVMPEPRYIDGELSMPYPPKYVEAGFFPEFVGNGFQNFDEQFPLAMALSPEDLEIGMYLDEYSGYADPIDFGMFGRIMLLEGKPLAFFIDDLKEAGYDPDNAEEVFKGIIDLFHIKIETPGYDSVFPERAKLHLKYICHDYDEILDASLDMKAREPGDYYFSSRRQVLNTIRTLFKGMDTPFHASGPGRELKLVRMTGFDESTTAVMNMPRVEGVVMTHEIGSYMT